MELTDVIRRRRMVRAFDPDRPVAGEVVDRMLRHAVRAPSAGFSQGWDFVVLQEQQDRDLFWRTTTDPAREPDRWLRGVSRAPVLVLCCSDPQAYLARYAEPDKGWEDRDPARWPVPYWDVDNGMAALLMLLTAVDEGLGALYFGVPPEHQGAVKSAFALPPDRRVVGVVAVGHPATDPRTAPRGSAASRRRRPLEEVAHRGRYGVPWSIGSDGV
ncbi:nitroreductase family protein [Ornithinimicrobium tianjinense]|uniref:Nitroreductase n=1 Tax=Ornithinimicrobium tianjinense TaxID=1195761 RepID=A0A917BJK9_9MICO|nr:nitroreductase family protein [Ornithinimicrobium tianjinense]GGF45803.1 nitroreductase [Ornithinimicrobium tianjinense]